MTKQTEQVITYRTEDGELVEVVALANSKDRYRNYVKFRVEKIPFNELAE